MEDGSQLGEVTQAVKKSIPSCLSRTLSSDINPEFICLLKEAEDDLSKCRKLSVVVKRAQAVLDRIWELLNTGHWSKVPLAQRQVYTAAALLKIQALLDIRLHGAGDDALRVPDEDVYRRALQTADMGLLLGAPLVAMDGRSMTQCAQVLTRALSQGSGGARSAAVATTTSSNGTAVVWTCPADVPGVHGQRVPILDRPSLEMFRVHHFNLQYPVKLTGCMEHWPALSRWTDMHYLRTVAGPRTVPVELGVHYADADWSQKLMTLSTFIDDYVSMSRGAAQLGYLAQHPLFQQVPELRADIYEPDYCCLSDVSDSREAADAGSDQETDVNAWFGPAGTVSPLHHDPKHNLLSQVVGEKRVLLYHPSDSERLYPHQTTLLENTAQVDPEKPDYDKYPQYRNTSPLECHLHAGEMLYIPPRWWHHVRALSTSFSVSFWWRQD